jgi:hypothetical protein
MNPRIAWWFAGLLALALVAFWPSYLSTFPAGDFHVHTHASLMLLWFGFLFAQPLLIRRGRRDLHRLLGRVSYLLVPLIAAQSVLLAHARFRVLDESTLAAEGHFLFLPLSAAFLFLAVWLFGIQNRRRMPLHARYMLCTALPLIDPVVARLLFFYAPPLPHPLLYTVIGYGITDAILLALLLREKRGSAERRVFGILLALFAGTHLVWFTFGQTAAWLAFAHWFSGLRLG